jgi:hypothetical protein
MIVDSQPNDKEPADVIGEIGCKMKARSAEERPRR